ncbi:tetratricopeptide repeat protein [Paenibacillus sp. FSL W7-1279]|uniref:tetratricopeptide repeat protein n=1 Tax=Paenibacillus sp. FSL W7-1279 TaxID=2921697 RepID=UPI0030D9C8E1
MTTNQLALEAIESNDYERALLLFQQAVRESRDVQSLHNLAFFYVHEGLRNDQGCWEAAEDLAIELLKECIELQPRSHFPYQLLGEAYLNLEQWEEALVALERAARVHPTPVAMHNAAVAAYRLENVELAVSYFGQSVAAGDNEYTKYEYAACLVETKRYDEALAMIEKLMSETGDYIGDVEIAELYLEMGQYHSAVTFYEKGWREYAKDPRWVNRFIYSLIRTGQNQRAEEIAAEAVQENRAWIADIQHDPEEDEFDEENQASIRFALDDIENYQTIISRFTEGEYPVMDHRPSILTACYWFGCKRHGHPEYV